MFLRLHPHVVFHIPLFGRGNIAGEYVYSSCMPSPLTTHYQVPLTSITPNLTGLRAASGVFRDVHDGKDAGVMHVQDHDYRSYLTHGIGLCMVGFSQYRKRVG